LVEGAHNGYLTTFGLIHNRVIFLSADGSKSCGEDKLIGKSHQGALIHFHLHPSVQASLIEAGTSVLLKFGKFSGWIYRASTGK